MDEEGVSYVEESETATTHSSCTPLANCEPAHVKRERVDRFDNDEPVRDGLYIDGHDLGEIVQRAISAKGTQAQLTISDSE